MAQILDSNTEDGFIFASVLEFIKLYREGKNSRLFLESYNGEAFLSFGCFLGGGSQVKPKVKTKKKQERDNQRAADFQRRKEESSENVTPSTPTSTLEEKSQDEDATNNVSDNSSQTGHDQNEKNTERYCCKMQEMWTI